jgi:PKD repeat protein
MWYKYKTIVNAKGSFIMLILFNVSVQLLCYIYVVINLKKTVMKTIVLFALTLVLCNTASAQLTAGFMANKWDICINDSLLVTDTSTTATGTITSWTWNFGDGSAPFLGQQPPYHHYAVGNATYTVTLMVINSTNDTAVVTHAVIVRPATVPILQITPAVICQNTPITFMNVAISSFSIDAWYVGDSVTLGNPFVWTFDSVGTDTVCLYYATASNNCASKTCTTLTVNPSPKPIVQATPSPACAYTSVNFSNIGTSVDSVPFYIWTYDSNGTITNGNINYITQNSGTDSVCLTVQTIKGCKGSTCSPFTVYPKAEPYFTDTVCANLTICFTDSSNSVLATNWFWTFGDGNTSTLQNPTHTYGSAGSYTVSLVTQSSYGCSEYYSKTVNIPNTLGLNSVINSTIQGISIINNTLYINTTQPLQYTIYSVSGQVIAQGNAAPQQGVIQLNTVLANGIYFIQLTQGEQRVTKKIVVQE